MPGEAATASKTEESTGTAVLEAGSQTDSDKALEALLAAGDDADETAPQPAAKRDDRGRFAAKPNELAPASELSAETAKPTPVADAPSDDDIKRAMAALQRDGYPDLEAQLKSNPQQLVAFGLKRAKVQADVSSYSDQLKKAKRELTELKATTTDVPKAGDAAQPASGEQLPELDSVTQPMVKYFEEMLGENAAEPLKESFNSLAKLISSSLTEQFEKKLSDLSQQVRSGQLEQERKNLEKKWPGITDSERWGKVLKHLDVIEKDADFTGDLNAKVNYSAQIEFAPEMAKEAQKVLKETHAQRDQGSPVTGTPPGQPGEESIGELSDAALQARMEGQHAKAEEIEKVIRRRRAA